MSKAFISKVFKETYGVDSHEWLENGLCLVDRGGEGTFTVGFVWEHKISLNSINKLLEAGPAFIASVPSGAIWDGEAMHACEDNSIGWGGIGTLRTACGEGDPSKQTEKTTKFARRIIRQLPGVSDVKYINSYVTEVSTPKKSVRIALVDAYDLCSDDVRSAWDELGPFDLIFKNNPNGGITEDARVAADNLDVKIADARSLRKTFASS